MKQSTGPEIRNRPRLRRALLQWYDQNRRDLPWRKTRDPYRIWVSEIMLQQTRVAAVIERYERFLKKFPSVHGLAAAREASVLAEWSGLGYYRRARNLHAAAKTVAREGKFPHNAEAWRTLPGIGRYTAAAIASIAFNEPIAALDGNVERVLRRLLGQPLTSAAAWQVAEDLLDRARPGDFNQAIMELGATVCVPGQPLCAGCPIQAFCCTRGRDYSPRRKARQRKRDIAYELATSDGSLHLVRRSKNASLMPGMWELPQCAEAVNENQLLFSLKHSITNTDYHVRVIKCLRKSSDSGSWVNVSRVPQLALTGLARKILCKAGIIR
jgi:A/G-specific adenine glycosylase